MVENSSGDEQTERLAERFGARYIREPRVGHTRARNTGARSARGDIVAFTDDDAVADKHWLRYHADALSNPQLAATAGRVLPLHTDTLAAQVYDSVGAEDIGAVGFTLTRHDPHWFEMANFGGAVVGPNMAFRRRLFEDWGFREDLGLPARILGDEHYAFFDLLRRGNRVAYVPESIVRHEPPATLPAVGARRRRTLWGGSAYLTMLIVEERGFRMAALRYALTGRSGRRRSWRQAQVQAPFASRLELVTAAFAGPVIYLVARAEEKFGATRTAHDRHYIAGAGGKATSPVEGGETPRL